MSIGFSKLFSSAFPFFHSIQKPKDHFLVIKEEFYEKIFCLTVILALLVPPVILCIAVAGVGAVGIAAIKRKQNKQRSRPGRQPGRLYRIRVWLSADISAASRQRSRLTGWLLCFFLITSCGDIIPQAIGIFLNNRETKVK